MDSIDFNNFNDLIDFSAYQKHINTAKGKQIVPEIRSLQQQQPTQFTRPQVQLNQFNAPSHQYGLFKQHSSFAPGAFQTLASQPQAAFASGSNAGFGSSSTFLDTGMEDFGDMNTLGLDSFNEMEEMNFGDFPGDVSQSNQFSIDPSVLNGDEEMSPTLAPAPRVWPGMYTQQAALAKAQQDEQSKLQMAAQQHSRRTSSSTIRGTITDDSIAKETISNLLDRMRNSSVAESVTSEQAGRSSGASKGKKPEEDMDEDERLLNSEEGKKLTSKERRQLRNKVSARAFRSRRKEYISQLEDDISAKLSQHHDMKSELEALRSENQRLTDLTKMLLAHPAFQQFCQDLNATQRGQQLLTPVTIPSTETPEIKQQSPQDAPKDFNPHARNLQMQQQQTGVQVGMVMIPESNWGMGFNNNAQVYAVTQIPDEPIIETSVLSGKSTVEDFTSFSEKPSFESITSSEKMLPVIPQQTSNISDNGVELDEEFELYNNQASAVKTSSAEDVYQIFGAIPVEKALARFELVVEGEESERVQSSKVVDYDAAVARFSRLQNRLESICDQVAHLTSQFSS